MGFHKNELEDDSRFDVPTSPLVTSLHSTQDIFEHGIDPNVGDPNQCDVGCCAQSSCSHAPQQAHIGVLEKEEDWPSNATLLISRKTCQHSAIKSLRRIRIRKSPADPQSGRVLFMTLEHEA